MNMFRNVIAPKLTELQKKFVNEFIKSLNPFESCKKAGYSEKNIKSALVELFKSEKVQSVIDQKIDESVNSLTPCKAFFVKKLLEIVTATTAKEEVLDRTGNSTGKTKISDAGVALRALEALAKYFPDSEQAQTTTSPDIVCIENLNQEKI